LFTKTNTKHTTATQQTKSVKWNDNKRDDFVNIVHNQHSELTSIISDLENIQLSNEGSQQDVHTSSIVIDRYSNFGNTYWSKEFARVLGPGQIVTSLEHLAQCRDVQVTSLCGLGLTHVRLF
jgi:archaellum component FlaF (FlaF/FlaG flagellin family)